MACAVKRPLFHTGMQQGQPAKAVQPRAWGMDSGRPLGLSAGELSLPGFLVPGAPWFPLPDTTL